MKKVWVFAALVLLAMQTPEVAERTVAQGVDSSCLVLWQYSPYFPGPGYGWNNSDSVKVDMCPGSQYLQPFAKDSFLVAFRYFIVPYSMDDSAMRTWRDIDTAYGSIRDGFDSIEQQLGPFMMQLSAPGADTIAPGAKAWWINFEHYVNRDTALYYLGQLPELNTNFGALFEGNPSFWEGVNPSEKQDHLEFWPQPCSRQLFIRGVQHPENIEFYDILGRQISLPVASSDGMLTVDLSTQVDGMLYYNISGHSLSILVQR